jgi:hypothetical protein
MQTTTTPGAVLYGNDEHTSLTWVTADTNYYYPSAHLLADAQPPSQQIVGPGTVSYQVGMTAGVRGANITSKLARSYATTDMNVVQGSSYPNNDYYVRHEFTQYSDPASNTFTSTPGFTVRTTQSLCLKIPYTNKAEWDLYDPYGQDTYFDTWINSWRQVCGY